MWRASLNEFAKSAPCQAPASAGSAMAGLVAAVLAGAAGRGGGVERSPPMRSKFQSWRSVGGSPASLGEQGGCRTDAHRKWPAVHARTLPPGRCAAKRAFTPGPSLAAGLRQFPELWAGRSRSPKGARVTIESVGRMSDVSEVRQLSHCAECAYVDSLLDVSVFVPKSEEVTLLHTKRPPLLALSMVVAAAFGCSAPDESTTTTVSRLNVDTTATYTPWATERQVRRRSERQHLDRHAAGHSTCVAALPANSSSWTRRERLLPPANVGNGLCVDVNGAGTADGTAVIQYTCGTGTNQQWLFTDSNAAETLTARHSGKLLDVSGSGTADGTKLQQSTGPAPPTSCSSCRT